MTNMKRTSVSFPKELAERIYSMRKDDRYMHCSYSELIRRLAERGLELFEHTEQTESGGEG